MRISTWYDFSGKIKNEKLESFAYKICKVSVNLFYPITAKPQYGLDLKSDIVVSLTSFPDRISTIWITICTLLNQTVKPSAIILWLASEQFPNGENDLPKKLLDMKKYGLSIRFCDNLYPHKKYYYAMLEYPNKKIITVDDDVFYPEYLIEELAKASDKYSNAVCCTWAHKITLDENGHVKPYSEWEYGIRVCKVPQLRTIPIGIGGVLYPAGALDERVFDKNGIQELCIRTDDLWLKCMAVLKKTPAVRIDKVFKRTFFTQVSTQKYGLKNENVGQDKNTIVMQALVKAYPEVEIILKGEVEDDNKG